VLRRRAGWHAGDGRADEGAGYTIQAVDVDTAIGWRNKSAGRDQRGRVATAQR